MRFDDVINMLDTTQRGDGYRAKCPAHDGSSNDSLSITRSPDGLAVMYCHAGCLYTDVLSALGDVPLPAIAHKNGNSPPSTNHKNKTVQKSIVQIYEYTDEAGNYLFEKVRYEPKTFRARVKVAAGHEWSLRGIDLVLYNLPSVTVADTIYVVEGEKDADLLISLGLVATCNYDGASKSNQKPKWDKSYNQYFKNKIVYIIPDNDEPGDAHATNIKRNINQLAKSVRIIELPDLPIGGDVSDWMNAGHTLDELTSICNRPSKQNHKWNIKTLHDVPDERPQTKYIIDPILPEASLNIWYGPSGSKKSLIIKDACFSIISSGDFIAGNMPPMPTVSTPILWIDLDNGDDVMDERIAAFRKTRNISNDAPFYYVSMPNPWPFLGDINSQIDLRMLINDLKIGLVIIDNLGAIAGDIEENSAKMVTIMSPLRSLANETRCAIILIHHPRKGGANGGRAGDALRGHSVIEASLDYAISITNDEQTGIVTMKCTKARRFSFPPIKAQWNYTWKDGTHDLDTAWFSAPVWKRGQNDVRDSLLTVLEATDGITKGRLIDQVYDMLEHGKPRSKITSWLDDMVAIEKSVLVNMGLNNAKIYTINPNFGL